jgi:hypothetical protein
MGPGMGRDGQTAGLMHRQDRCPERAVGPDRAVEVEPSRWPPRVVTSSPTTTSARRPRSRAIAWAATAAVDPLMIGDGDDVEVGPCLDVVEDRGDAGRAIARRACGCAGPHDRGGAWRRSCGGPRAPGLSSGGPAASVASAPPQPRDPARSGRRPPTTDRGVGDEVLERGGQAGHGGRHPFAARPLCGTSIGMILPRKCPPPRAAGRSSHTWARLSRRRASPAPSA